MLEDVCVCRLLYALGSFLTTSNGMDAGGTYGWTRNDASNVTGLETGTGDITG